MLRLGTAFLLLCTGCLSSASHSDGGEKPDMSKKSSPPSKDAGIGELDFSLVFDFAGPQGDMTILCNKPATTTLDPSNGHHNPGQDCISCHNGDFTVAGTLYNTKSGGTGLSGATITIDDSLGLEYTIVTTSNGNFWSSSAFNFPITVRASLCPTVMQMTDQVNNGSCNESMCHDLEMPMYVQ